MALGAGPSVDADGVSRSATISSCVRGSGSRRPRHDIYSLYLLILAGIRPSCCSHRKNTCAGGDACGVRLAVRTNEVLEPVILVVRFPDDQQGRMRRAGRAPLEVFPIPRPIRSDRNCPRRPNDRQPQRLESLLQLFPLRDRRRVTMPLGPDAAN